MRHAPSTPEPTPTPAQMRAELHWWLAHLPPPWLTWLWRLMRLVQRGPGRLPRE